MTKQEQIDKYELARKILFDILYLNTPVNEVITNYCKKRLEVYRLNIVKIKENKK